MPASSSSLASLTISRRRVPVASSATVANTSSRPATCQRHQSDSNTSDSATPGGAVVSGLAGAVLALSLSLGSPSHSSAEPTQPQTEVAQSTQQVMEGVTPVYFGNGCFWGRQKDFVDTERTLGRSMGDVSAVVGYAGGRSGVSGRVCYYYAEPGTVYEGLGHAEVVQVGLNGGLEEKEKQMQMFAQTYFSQFKKTPFGMIRQDPQDAGPGYRNVIGISGGINGPYMDIIRKENVNNMKLVEGKGNQYVQGQATEPDRINTVYVLDSDNMPFYRAEQYHQFHNGLGKAFPMQYTRDQRQAAAAAGRIDTTGCPEYPY